MESLLFALLGWIAGVIVNRMAENFTSRRAYFAAPVCSNCSTPRRVVDQSGILRWLFGRRNCSNCGVPAPAIAPLVEVTSAITFAALWITFGATFALILYSLYTVVFLAVLVIDLKHRLIPNAIILPATIFAAVASPWSPLGLTRSLLGGGIALVIVLAIYAFGKVFERVRGYHIRGGVFGQGDVKLAAFMGIVTGFPGVFTAILYTILLGGVGAILYLAFHFVAHRRWAMGLPIPYGPFFCIAGWFVMVMRR